MLRFLLWRLLALLAALVGYLALGWLLAGGPGRLLRGQPTPRLPLRATSVLQALAGLPEQVWDWRPVGVPLVGVLFLPIAALAAVLVLTRWSARARRVYVRMRVEGHRTDQAHAQALVRMHDVVQFLDGPSRPGDGDAGGDAVDGDDRELVGVGAEDLDITF